MAKAMNSRHIHVSGVFGGIMGGFCTAMGTMGKPIVNTVKDGINYANSVIGSEITMFASKLYVGATLAFDSGASLVTGFGAWLSGIVYDGYKRIMKE